MSIADRRRPQSKEPLDGLMEQLDALYDPEWQVNGEDTIHDALACKEDESDTLEAGVLRRAQQVPESYWGRLHEAMKVWPAVEEQSEMARMLTLAPIGKREWGVTDPDALGAME